MKAAYVAPKRTPLTFDAAAKTMKWALKCVLGHDPNDETLALALAKTALETGRWTQIWNDNWGNVKAGNDYAGMFTCITLNEVLKGKVVWFAPEGGARDDTGDTGRRSWMRRSGLTFRACRFRSLGCRYSQPCRVLVLILSC